MRTVVEVEEMSLGGWNTAILTKDGDVRQLQLHSYMHTQKSTP